MATRVKRWSHGTHIDRTHEVLMVLLLGAIVLAGLAVYVLIFDSFHL